MTKNASRSRLKWAFIFLALTATLFVVIASACGGGDDDNGGDNKATPTKEAGNSGSSTNKATPTKEASNNNGGGDDATAALSKFASDYERFTGKVKYEMKDFSGTDASGLTSMAIYQSADSSRVDIESSNGNVIIIDTPNASYMCTENQCLKSPAGDNSANPAAAFTEIFDPKTIQDEFGSLQGVDIKTSKEKIAGIQATCIHAKGDLDATSPGDEEGEICFAEGGLLLRLTFSTGGKSGTFEAAEASTKVSGSDFEPPYEVVDLSRLGQ